MKKTLYILAKMPWVLWVLFCIGILVDALMKTDKESALILIGIALVVGWLWWGRKYLEKQNENN